MTNPGRNDPCPCGSGKKYKRCCGALGSTNTQQSPGLAATLPAGELRVALELHRSGRLAEAEIGYRRVLEQTPEQPDALHYLA
jgi:hypothetical protein